MLSATGSNRVSPIRIRPFVSDYQKVRISFVSDELGCLSVLAVFVSFLAVELIYRRAGDKFGAIGTGIMTSSHAAYLHFTFCFADIPFATIISKFAATAASVSECAACPAISTTAADLFDGHGCFLVGLFMDCCLADL